MTEYWVSKKQYWCKYCSIWIRDDAPSRRLHETGLKHQGNKERYIRDLYKSGNQAKRDKAQEAAEIARIEAAAEAAYAHDTHLPGSSRLAIRPNAPIASASTSRIRDRPKDKWSNYTSAKDLGFDDDETQKSSYEIEQELKGRAGEAGGWEEVEEEPPVYPAEVEGQPAGKRKLGEYAVEDEEDHESFKFKTRDKRPPNDVYDDSEWDPKAALGGLKLKKKEESWFKKASPNDVAETSTDGLDRSKWHGRLELEKQGESSGAVYQPELGGWVKSEVDESALPAPETPPVPSEDVKPTVTEATASSGIFKKRRPPQSRKK